MVRIVVLNDGTGEPIIVEIVVHARVDKVVGKLAGAVALIHAEVDWESILADAISDLRRDLIGNSDSRIEVDVV